MTLFSAMRPARPRRSSLWSALLAVLALGVMAGALVVAVRGPAPAAVATGPPAEVVATSAVPVVPEPGGLNAGATAVLPAPADAPADRLARLVGSPVQAVAVTVQSVAADEGFWVGDSTEDRIWVQLVGSQESPYSVAEGDRVDLTGRVVAHAGGWAADIGVNAGEGAEQLTAQGAHVEVEQRDLRPTG